MSEELEVPIAAWVSARAPHLHTAARAVFGWRAGLARMRRTWLADLFRHPLNLLLAVPSLLVKRAAGWAERLGFSRLHLRLVTLPLSFPTAYERSVEAEIKAALFASAPAGMSQAALSAALVPVMREYFASRNAIADALASGLSLVIGSLFFGNAALSPLAMGNELASHRAQERASEHFILGRSLGHAFHRLFPAHANFKEIALATSAVMLAITVLTLAATLLVDPLMQGATIHERQLARALRALEDRLILEARRTPHALVREPSAHETWASAQETLAFVANVSTTAAGSGARATRRGMARLGEWLGRGYARLESRFGPQRAPLVAVAAGVLLFAAGIGLRVALRTDPYREARKLLAAHAYPTALARLEQMYAAHAQSPEYWFLRARAFAGEGHTDAAMEAYGAALVRDPDYRSESVVIADVVAAVADANNERAKKLVREQLGPQAVPELLQRMRAAEDVYRWELVRLAEALGAGARIDYAEVALADWHFAEACADRRRALQKLVDYQVRAARAELQAKKGDKCLEPALSRALTANWW